MLKRTIQNSDVRTMRSLDVMKDISLNLSLGIPVIITYDPQKISRGVATQILLKNLPLEDVYRVRQMDKNDFERQKEQDDTLKNAYVITADEIARYLH